MEQWEQIIADIKLPEANQDVYIWGAGNTSVLNHQGMLREKLYEKFRIIAFLDSKLAGTSFCSFPVLAPKELDGKNPKDVYIFISTTNSRVFHEIENECIKKGFSCCLLDAAILMVRQEEFRKSRMLLDSDSREIYQLILANRATADEPGAFLISGESYFGIPDFCRCNPRDVIIDCGAYVGDSAERFIWRMEQFQQYIAIEPDKKNYLAMCKRFKRLNEEWNFPEGKLIALNVGVDAVSLSMTMETRVGGLGSIAHEAEKPEDECVPFWTLDDLLPKGFSFLKADIESYEYRMLCGARKSIQRHHPRMAICIYHNMIDMFSIPQLIHEIEPSYRLAIRHHSYGYEETVLYAY